jgi:hypothetical protein
MINTVEGLRTWQPDYDYDYDYDYEVSWSPTEPNGARDSQWPWSFLWLAVSIAVTRRSSSIIEETPDFGVWRGVMARLD